MTTQADVQSIEALKDLRVALALYGEETLSTLSAVEMEIHRTLHWLQYDRPTYWKEQLKRRQEKVSAAKAEVFRRKLAKTADYTPAFTEQKEQLRAAEASLAEAEKRIALVKKWGPLLQQAILEYHASSRRISDIASADVPRAVGKLTRMIDALEAYLRVSPPSGTAPTAVGSGTPSQFETIANEILDQDDEVSNKPPAENGGAPDVTEPLTDPNGSS
jgi:hypothetical protein